MCLAGCRLDLTVPTLTVHRAHHCLYFEPYSQQSHLTLSCVAVFVALSYGANTAQS